MTKLQNIIVVGGNTAGLVSAASLRKIGANVLVLESKSKESFSVNCKTYTGLWNPGLKVLSDFPVYEEVLSQSVSVTKSGYRNIHGDWTLVPTIGLKSSPKSPSLSFINDNLLRNVLLKISGNVNYNEHVQRIYHNGTSTIVESHCVHSGSCLSRPADLVVIADGIHSNMRKYFYPQKNFLNYRGYTVYRGHSSSSCTSTSTSTSNLGTRITNDSFQTWGEGARFACVPTKEGNAWFAAITDTAGAHPLSSYHRKIPLSQLQSRFHDWHDPIPTLLSHTDLRQQISTTYTGEREDEYPEARESGPERWVEGVEAWAYQDCVPGGLSGMLKSSNDIMDNKSAIAFVGDASHTLDPILAQGAGVAMEDAQRLAEALSTHVTCGSMGDERERERERELTMALSAYEKSRRNRLYRLHTLSNLAQIWGHIDNKNYSYARDVMLKAIPNSIKGYVFDRFIELSVSS